MQCDKIHSLYQHTLVSKIRLY